MVWGGKNSEQHHTTPRNLGICDGEVLQKETGNVIFSASWILSSSLHIKIGVICKVK